MSTTTLFDQTPNSSASGAVAGADLSALNTGERKGPHYIEEIYDPDKHPAEDLTKYIVPQENDLVFDVPNGIIYRVAHVDWQATLKSDLVLWGINNGNENTTTEQDWIFGLRGGPLAGEALLSIDYSQRPNVARVDATIMRPDAAYAKIFMGNDASDNGKIISAQYDQSMNLITNKVPVKLAEIVDRTNETIMTTGSFSVTENEEALPDGKRCTLIFYDEGGNFIPPAQPVMVQHSSYMRDHQLGTKYVTEVQLISPWFTNTTDPERLMVPINIALSAVELRAVVHYNDGSVSVDMPVNGDRFSLYGLEEYRPTWPGQEAELTLVYKLAADEQHFIADPGSPDHKNRVYVIQAAAVKGAYSPKIYTYPVWQASITGYKLMHFLHDLDRDTVIDVTALVKLNDKSDPWRPNLYGQAQSMIFNLNLRDVSPLYESVIFVQHTTIALYKDVNGPGKRWDVSFSFNDPFYDSKFVKAKNAGVNTTANVANGYASQAAWLEGMYRGVRPSFNRFDEDKAPDPTHFYLVHQDGRTWRYAIADWNKDNVITIAMSNGAGWFIRWVKAAANGSELILATTGLVVEVI